MRYSIPDSIYLLDASNSRPHHTTSCDHQKCLQTLPNGPLGKSILRAAACGNSGGTRASVLVLHFLHYDLDLLRSKFKSQSSQEISLKPHINNRVNRSVIYGVKYFFNSNTRSKGRPSLNQLIWFTSLLLFK